MSEEIRIPDVEDVLDWSVATEYGHRPLRYLTGEDLLFVAREAASIGDPDLADSLAAVADEVPDGFLVADLPRARFHELFWGTAADTIQASASEETP